LVGIGESLQVVAAAGTYNATITEGTGAGTVLATGATGGTYGPYAYQVRVLLVASVSSEIDFDVAVTPAITTDTPANCVFDTSGNITGLISPAGKSVTLATTLAPVSLSANTTLTRAAHYNRLIVVDVTAGNVTLTATGTDALLGDFISVDVIGGGSNTVTLAGVTAQSGYQLTAVSGGNVEARCDVAASFIASTRSASAGAGATATLALVNGDFTSNNLNLTATHTNRVLDCSAVTIPVTLTIQTDASGGYDTTAAELKVLGSTVAPVAIIKGTGATLVGEVQVIEQGGWGGARRKGVDSWAIVGQRKSGLSLGSSLSMFGISTPSAIGGSSINSFGMPPITAIDSSTTAAAASFSDGGPEYGTLRRVRQSGVAATNRSTGLQHVMSARMDTVNSHFPMVFRFGIADALEAASKGPLMVGICNTLAFANTLGTGPIEPTATTIGVDFIVIGGETSDTNMQLMHRSNATAIAATKVDLGAAFPKSQFVAYGLTIYKNNAGTAFMAVVENMNTQAIAVKILTTNLPRNDRSYHTLFVRTSGTNATAAALDYIGTVVGAS
jgi:hypothetical protein